MHIGEWRPSVWNLHSKRPTTLKHADFDRFPLTTSQPYKRQGKSSIPTNGKSTTCFSTSYRRSAYVTPKSPKRRLKSDFKKFSFNRIKSATKILCVKTSGSKVVVWSFPYLTVHRYWRETQPFKLKFSLKLTHPLKIAEGIDLLQINWSLASSEAMFNNSPKMPLTAGNGFVP